MISMGIRKAFHTLRKERIAVVAMAGFALGSTTRKNTLNREQPSMMAAFSRSLGMLKKNCRKKKRLNALEAVNTLVKNSAVYVLYRFMSTMVL